MTQEEVYCPHCKKIFYIRGYKLTNAKTISCLFCKKRFARLNASSNEKLDNTVKENKE